MHKTTGKENGDVEALKYKSKPSGISFASALILLITTIQADVRLEKLDCKTKANPQSPSKNDQRLLSVQELQSTEFIQC